MKRRRTNEPKESITKTEKRRRVDAIAIVGTIVVDIPNDIFFVIFDFLPFESLVSMRKTCIKFNVLFNRYVERGSIPSDIMCGQMRKYISQCTNTPQNIGLWHMTHQQCKKIHIKHLFDSPSFSIDTIYTELRKYEEITLDFTNTVALSESGHKIKWDTLKLVIPKMIESLRFEELSLVVKYQLDDIHQDEFPKEILGFIWSICCLLFKMEMDRWFYFDI